MAANPRRGPIDRLRVAAADHAATLVVTNPPTPRQIRLRLTICPPLSAGGHEAAATCQPLRLLAAQ
jgi:hypothetical protein